MIDVLIVGGGPTGLMAAIEMARFGLTCRIIDPLTLLSDKSKALAIQARTLELFDHLGIIEPFLKEGIKIQRATLFTQGKPLTRIDFTDLASPYPFILSVEQSTTEALLSQHAASLGVKIERGAEFLSLSQQDRTVTSIVRTANREEKIVSSWLIGCDGAHSAVRKSLGLEFKGQALPTIFSLADVTLDWQFPHDQVVFFLDKRGILIAIPLPEEKRYRLIFELEQCQSENSQTSTPTFSDVEEKIRTYIGPHVKAYSPSWLASFHVHSRLVDKLWQGRVFLAGDSAHIHSPAGGQGMNGGLQDVDNLAWKLSLVHKNKAKKEILDTYTLERRFVAKAVLKKTEQLTHISMLQNPALIWLRNKLVPLLMQIPSIQNRFVKALSQTAIHYPQNSLIIGRHAGRRAPNIAIGKTDLYTLCRKTTDHHLLLFSGLEGTEENLLSIAKQFEEKATPIFIIHKTAHQTYRVKAPTLYLIRPDMYIAATAPSDNLHPIIQYFASFS